MNDITFFAQTTFRNQMRKFGIKTDDRRRHMYLIGKTGMGKSTILENMIIDDIRSGHGVAVVDPHGDLAEKIIEFIPKERIKDVIYFNPADIDYPIAFNVVEQVEPHLRHLVASGLIGVFQKLWADSWGPRLEYILRNAILAILDYPGSTLLGVVRILSDKSFRKKVVSNIQDPVVKAFWEKEFASYADKFASEAVSPIQNKVGQFLSTAFMRNIVGQTSSAIDMRKVMDDGKILILNLSKGRIGEDNSALLGAMMITKIQLAAMSRVDIPEKERRDFYLYIDEFQNFSTDSFANILSEARKYRLCLVMAHQYVEQLDDKVKAAVFGNVGTMIVFRVGATDAEELVKEFTPTFTEEDIVNLPKYEMYLKLMIDGISSDPFSARGLPPLFEEEKTGNVPEVIAYTREHYASRKDEVEEKILRWHDTDDGPGEKGADGKEKPDDRPKFDAVCSRCGQPTKTVFAPDGVRPVYCKDCLLVARQEKENFLEQKKTVKQVEQQNMPIIAPRVSQSQYNPASTPVSTPNTFSPKPPVNNTSTISSSNIRSSDSSFNRSFASSRPAQRPISTPVIQQRPRSVAPVLRNSTPVASAPTPASQQPGISLSALHQATPVDFKGREIKRKPIVTEKADEDEESSQTNNHYNNGNTKINNPVSNIKHQEQDLAEGEDVFFND